jgi:hypothetical protein
MALHIALRITIIAPAIVHNLNVQWEEVLPVIVKIVIF